jgi:hypothetical protein
MVIGVVIILLFSIGYFIEMNNKNKTMSEFKWTDELAEKYAAQTAVEAVFNFDASKRISIEEFKKQQAVDKKDWEIVAFNIDGQIWRKRDNGKYGCNTILEYPLETMLNDDPDKIHSVRRLSDNEVFSIGDYITGTYSEPRKITEIIYLQEPRWTTGDQIYFKQRCGETGLSWAKKVKQPPTDPINEQLKKSIKHFEENTPIFSYTDLKNLAFKYEAEEGLIHLNVSDVLQFLNDKLK